MDKFAGIVDEWQEQDRQRPAKQRHTAQRIFERLRDEHEFKGLSSTVRRYIRKSQSSQAEVFMPLAYAPDRSRITMVGKVARARNQASSELLV